MSAKTLKWWEGYDGHELVIFDDFRADFCTLQIILKFLKCLIENVLIVVDVVIGANLPPGTLITLKASANSLKMYLNLKTL